MDRFSGEEYSRLWQEESIRLDLVYTLGHKVINITFTFWGFLFAALGVVLSNVMNLDKEIIMLFFVFAAFLFGFPLFIVRSNSYKYQENLNGIMNIAIYSMIFHEFNSYLKDKELKMWEMMHYNISNPKFYDRLASEQKIISLVTVILSMIVSLVSVLFFAVNFHNIIIAFRITVIALYVFYIFYAIFLIYFTLDIFKMNQSKNMVERKKSKTDKNEFVNEAINYYKKCSIDLKIYTKEDLINFDNYCKLINKNKKNYDK